jgi:hypothetical protein
MSKRKRRSCTTDFPSSTEASSKSLKLWIETRVSMDSGFATRGRGTRSVARVGAQPSTLGVQRRPAAHLLRPWDAYAPRLSTSRAITRRWISLVPS